MTSNPQERPILYQGAMVRGILADVKTQTRRVIKLPHMNPLGQWEPFFFGGPGGGRDRSGKEIPGRWTIGHSRTGEIIGCPYGQPGDRLWVRETWARNWNQLSDTRMDRSYVYRADGETRAQDNGTDLPWKPSTNMPRRASRILLEITEVRVQRLQEISEKDCWAEGIEEVMYDFDDLSHCVMAKRIGCCIDDVKPLFAQLWESINGPGSWDLNPWLWCISFRNSTGA